MTVVLTVVSVYPAFVSYLILIFMIMLKFLIKFLIFSCLMLH